MSLSKEIDSRFVWAEFGAKGAFLKSRTVSAAILKVM